MRRLPSLSAIEAFVQVARLGSIKGAADDLALSSPAISRRIQGLEGQLGRSLFERRHQSLVLTPDGEKLLERVAPALDELSDAIEGLTGAPDLLRLRLGVMPLFAAQRLIPRMGELRERYPNLHIDIDTAAHATTRLGDGIDVAIALAKDVDPGLYSRRLDHDRIFMIAARSLRVNGRPITSPKQMADATIILHREMPDTFDAWRDAVGLPDLEPAATDYYDSGPLMLEAAAQGLGVAFLHENHFDGTADERLMRLFDTDVRSPYAYWFVCRPKALDTKPVRLFHDWLIEQPVEAALS